MAISEKQFPSLCSFLVQVNNNITNITVNNYNADSLQLDVQFNQIEPIFPDDDFNLVMFKSFNARAGDIAAAVYHMGKNLFGVVPKKGAVEWWGWDARLNRWTAEKHFVEYFCMTTMVAYYEQVQQYFRLHTADPTLAKNRDIRFEQICKRLNDRELVHIVNSTAAHCREHDPGFKDKLDGNPALIGFTNGVYDLDANEFRPANPSDYITMSCGYAFEREVNHVVRAEIDKFFEDIQPHEDVRRYLQKFLGSCIPGGPKTHELFHIFSGETRNGKSAVADAMKYALGDYFTTIKSTLLTEKQGASAAASPDLMDLMKRRLAIASEPEKGKTINTGFMKGLTGNDNIVARQLYGEMVTFKPSHATVLLTNDIPPMDQTDAAVKAWVVVVPFPTTFVAVVTQPNHCLIDKRLKQRLKKWGPQLVLRLIEWHTWYCSKGLLRPKVLMDSTESYAQENNIPYRWFLTCTTEDETECIHLSYMFEKFVEWYQDTEGCPCYYKIRAFAKDLRSEHIMLPEFKWKGSALKPGVKGQKFI
ncbi:hypothetical protein HDU81_001032 [Chytriomyces hyalinus]|nr:hypothetical protein HDU81_001032 [Chytriomyces hyalinus]